MPRWTGLSPMPIVFMIPETIDETIYTALSKNFNNGTKMKYKSLNDIDTELMDLNEFSEPIQDVTPKKHYLDQCPDVSPQRFNEIVLQAIAEFNNKQKEA